MERAFLQSRVPVTAKSRAAESTLFGSAYSLGESSRATEDEDTAHSKPGSSMSAWGQEQSSQRFPIAVRYLDSREKLAPVLMVPKGQNRKSPVEVFTAAARRQTAVATAGRGYAGTLLRRS